MNLLVRVRHWLEERFQFSNALARLIRVFPAGNPLPHPRDVRTLADEGYRKNVIIYRCIREIAESAAEPVLMARRPGAHEPLTRHPLARLLQEPNDEQSSFSFIESLITHQQIAGSWYVHIVRSPNGLPVELWPLRPDRVEIVPGSGGRIERYHFTVDGRRIALDPADVIHDALLDPLDDYYGLSPIAVAALVADADSSAMDYLRRFFVNAATPAGIVKLKKKVPPEKRKEIKEKWEAQLRGPGGWHSVAVLDEDADYQSVGSPMKDLNLTGVLSETEARLCGVFGVPPIIVAAKLGLDRSTYANYEEARRSFWVETLRPMYRRFADRLTFALRREFGDVEVAFDFSKVGPLQESQEAIRKFAFLSWRDGLLTRNEARTSIGLPTVENGDVFRLTTNDLFLKEGDLPPAEPIQARREEEPPMLPPGRDGGNGNGNGNGTNMAGVRDERLALVRAALALVTEKAEFDPNQPRAPAGTEGGGQWVGEGGGAGGAGGDGGSAEDRPTAEGRAARFSGVAHTAAKGAGINPRIVHLSESPAGGPKASSVMRDGVVIGEYKDGKIFVYTRGRTEAQIAETIRHEAIHHKFDVAKRTDRSLERDIIKDYTNLRKDDGVSAYSRAHWEQSPSGSKSATIPTRDRWKYTLAVEETLAEIRATGSGGSSRYQQLLARVDQAYEKGRSP